MRQIYEAPVITIEKLLLAPYCGGGCTDDQRRYELSGHALYNDDCLAEAGIVVDGIDVCYHGPVVDLGTMPFGDS
ncbi:MAG: hypothetical protein LBS74_08940 [Oscillospiraceae bacterium]|jgi:hypothetical protein|nr:hypothetical protein [Oscillospiraceae bacterium]